MTKKSKLMEVEGQGKWTKEGWLDGVDRFEGVFKDVAWVTEASSYESMCLWEKYGQHPSPDIHWREVSRGTMVTIGFLDKRPVCLTFQYAYLNNRRVAFWEASSQVVDHKMIDEWFDKYASHIRDSDGRMARSDAMNFGHCINFCRENKV